MYLQMCAPDQNQQGTAEYTGTVQKINISNQSAVHLDKVITALYKSV